MSQWHTKREFEIKVGKEKLLFCLELCQYTRIIGDGQIQIREMRIQRG